MDQRRHMIRTLIFVGLIGVILSAGGCVMEDFTSLGDSFTTKNPSEAARMMFDPHNPDNRREGTVLVSNSPFGGGDVYIAAYRDMVEHETDSMVRAAAIRALARHGAPDDAALIAVHLEDVNDQVRWEAAKGLQRLHNTEVVPSLLATVRSKDEIADVREAAVTALGQYPQDRVVQGLIEALRARELSVNVAAERSLQLLTGQAHGLDPLAWFAWYREAAVAGVAFDGGSEYLYPVYARDETFLEKVNIFSNRVYEQPAPPAGLRSASGRRTYDDDAEDASATEGG